MIEVGADGVDAANEVDADNLGIGGVPLERVLGGGCDEGGEVLEARFVGLAAWVGEVSGGR